MAQVRVLIADSTDVMLAGLKSIFKSSRSIDVIGTAQSASEAIKAILKDEPDVSLITRNLEDLNIHEFMEALQKKLDESRVVLLSDRLDITHLNQALKAGVAGYLMNNISKRNLTAAVKSAAEGEKVFSNSISSLMANLYADQAGPTKGQPMSPITKREAEVLQLIADGYTSQEIANLLYISPRTVETHRSNILSKLNMKNTAELVRYALEQDRSERI